MAFFKKRAEDDNKQIIPTEPVTKPGLTTVPADAAPSLEELMQGLRKERRAGEEQGSNVIIFKNQGQSSVRIDFGPGLSDIELDPIPRT